MEIDEKYLTRIFEKNIPEELKKIDHWVNWKPLIIKGKITKPPLKVGGGFASVDDQNTWSSFSAALDKALKKNQGIGFVLTGDYIGLDFDHVILGNSYKNWSTDIIDCLNTYLEKSPSGTGVRGILKGKIPEWFINRKVDETSRFEMWDNKRYITITGDAIKNKKINYIDLELCLKNIRNKY